LGSLYAGQRLRTRLVRLFYEPLQRLACHISDLTVFYNPADRDVFLERGLAPPGRARVMAGSGVRCDRFDPAAVSESARRLVRNELGVRRDGIMVTMAARLIHSKGVREFADAARLLSGGEPPIRFVLAGEWDRQAVDALDEKEVMQLRGTVVWAGERPDMPALWAASDVAVLASHGEGLPRALIEAASMGLPLVASDVPGCRQVVEQDVNGTLVPVRDAAALATAILRLARDPALRQRWGKASRRQALARFDLRLVANALAEIYRALLTQQRWLLADSLPAGDIERSTGAA
jgi:glycosyltransferase involved in cell wall biosynthesis